MFDSLIYTLTAVLLYLISDWLLQRMELNVGRRFEHRNFIFFFILAFLAVTSFAIFKYLLVNQ